MSWQNDLNIARKALAEGRYHDALQWCDRVAAGKNDYDGRYQAVIVRGGILLHMGDPKGALSCYDTVADPHQLNGALDLARGLALYEMGALPEADSALRSASREPACVGAACYTLGLIAEIFGSGEDVELFRRARRSDPVKFPPVKALSLLHFHALLDDIQGELEEQLKVRVQSVPLRISQVPSMAELRDTSPVLSPSARGRLMWRSDPTCVEGIRPEMVLFKRNLERQVTTLPDLKNEIRYLLVSEISLCFDE